MVNVAIIPARGGSKRIPRKNIKLFHGKPIIAYSIETAIQSGIFDRVIVSTDDNEIAEVAIGYGAEVPFIRPDYLSNDNATTIDTLIHAEEFIKLQGEQPDYLCCIYATSPLLPQSFVKKGLKALSDSNSSCYAFSVTKYNYPVARSFSITDSKIEMLFPDNYNKKTQDLNETYHDAGQFYWWKRGTLKKDSCFFCEKSLPILIESRYVHDIDTAEDFAMAELKYSSIDTSK